VGQDEDELMDVYDVRVGGGLSAQNPPPPPPPCESAEQCHEGLPARPPEAAPVTPNIVGGGNVKPARPKKHKHKKHKHKKQHRANAKRRAGQ
jgi:hypothetical protein